MATDKYNRPLTSIRISITQRCNLNCIYCHREGQDSKSDREMTVDEIIRILKLSTRFGIKKVKYTGGEPLLREDLPEIIQKSRKITDLEDISIVTNGTLLENYAQKLSKAGLDRINVTLDTLDPQLYADITNNKGALVDQVQNGIKAALSVGIEVIKVNMVLLKDINTAEISSLIDFCKTHHLILQLIELVPTKNLDLFKQYHVDMNEIEAYLTPRTKSIKIRKTQNRKKYFLKDGVEVEIVNPFHNSKFCANCHRLRITSSGMIKPCLMRNDNLVDILTPLRNGASDEELAKLFQRAIDLREPYCK
jgi:cyclic pyranopterin phosphate synthase